MILKHKKWRDICLKVHKVHKFNTSSTVKVKGQYWNLGFVESYPIWDDVETLKIDKADWQSWEVSYDDLNLKCWRNSNWHEPTGFKW